jgi:hypothetical protein
VLRIRSQHGPGPGCGMQLRAASGWTIRTIRGPGVLTLERDLYSKPGLSVRSSHGFAGSAANGQQGKVNHLAHFRCY